MAGTHPALKIAWQVNDLVRAPAHREELRGLLVRYIRCRLQGHYEQPCGRRYNVNPLPLEHPDLLESEEERIWTIEEKAVALAAFHDALCTGADKINSCPWVNPAFAARPASMFWRASMTWYILNDAARSYEDWWHDDHCLQLNAFFQDVQAWLNRSADAGCKVPSGEPTGVEGRKARRRTRSRKPTPLTAGQIEAIHLVGENKGNVAAAAEQVGITRQAMAKRYRKANKKLGRSASKLNVQTQRLPQDRRGQVDVEDPRTIDED